MCPETQTTKQNAAEKPPSDAALPVKTGGRKIVSGLSGACALCAWCFTAALISLRQNAPVTELEQYHAFGIVPACIIFCSVFFLLFVVCSQTKYKNAAIVLLPVFFGAYSYLLLRKEDDPWFVFGFSSLWAVLIFHYARRDYLRLSLRINERTGRRMLAVMIFLFLLIVGGLGVLRIRTFSSPNFDFGIFSQMFYYMKSTLRPLTTCEREKLLSHFAVHLSPVLYLLLPVYCLFPYPETLQLAQAAILACAAIPLYLLAGRLRLSAAKAVVCTALLLLYPAVGYSENYDFHENCFLLPFLLWMFYFFECGRFRLCALFAGLTLLTKEDAAVYVAFFALYVLCDRKKVRFSVLLGLFAAGYFIAALLLLSAYGEGVMTGRYNNYIVLGGGLPEAVVNVLLCPAYVFTQLFRDENGASLEKILFALQMFAPLCFLPFCCKKTTRLTLLFPVLLLHFMTVYVYQFRVGYQYAFGSAAFLFYLLLLNLREMRAVSGKAALGMALAISLMCFFTTTYRETKENLSDAVENRAQYALMRETVRAVPDNAAVTASAFLCPQLSQRAVLYEDVYHQPIIGEPIDLVLLDLRYDHEEEKEKYAAVGFTQTETVSLEGEDLILIMKRPPRNE